MTNQIINIAQVSKSFPHNNVENQVLNNVNFSIEKGEYVAITGPSGSGKSTLLNILGLMDTPDSGDYQLDGKSITNLSANERAAQRNQYIGFVFQSFNLIDEADVLDNVALPLKYRGISVKEAHQKATECLAMVGLSDKASFFPNQLSGGQQQRVSIARALAVGSGILLVDEPTGNLDSANGDIVMNLLSELHQKGTTIILVTHDPRYGAMAERQITLFDGQVTSDKRIEITNNREVA